MHFLYVVRPCERETISPMSEAVNKISENMKKNLFTSEESTLENKMLIRANHIETNKRLNNQEWNIEQLKNTVKTEMKEIKDIL